MANWLNKEQINSVEYLSQIRKAVYLMKSITEQGCYRFGGIGAVNGQANTPIRRLGQCTHVKDAAIQSAWLYVAMLKLDEKTSAERIRELEKIVRNDFFNDFSSYKRNQVSRRDALEKVENCDDLISRFKKSLEDISF